MIDQLPLESRRKAYSQVYSVPRNTPTLARLSGGLRFLWVHYWWYKLQRKAASVEAQQLSMLLLFDIRDRRHCDWAKYISRRLQLSSLATHNRAGQSMRSRLITLVDRGWIQFARKTRSLSHASKCNFPMLDATFASPACCNAGSTKQAVPCHAGFVLDVITYYRCPGA